MCVLFIKCCSYIDTNSQVIYEPLVDLYTHQEFNNPGINTQSENSTDVTNQVINYSEVLKVATSLMLPKYT